MHASSMENMKYFVEKYLTKQQLPMSVADIGSQVVDGNNADESYKKFFMDNGWAYYGCDVSPGNNVDIVLTNPYHWKQVKTEFFDVVVSGQTLEHIEFVWATFMEIARVLKTGGLCCIIVPSSGSLHRYPLDCWRFYEDGLAALARFARLEVLEVFTQRSRFDNPHYDPHWQDSVLICRKPNRNIVSKIKFALANWAMHAMTKNITFNANTIPIPFMMNSQLFYALSDGEYNASQSIDVICEVKDDKFKVYYDLSSIQSRCDITSLRFDPACTPIKLAIKTAEIKLLTSDTPVQMTVFNTNGSLNADGLYVFDTDDPIVIFDCKGIDFFNADYFSVQGCCYLLRRQSDVLS